MGGKLTIGINEGPESIEKPTVTVEFLLVLLLEAKDNLHRASTI